MSLKIVNFVAESHPAKKVFVTGEVQDGNGNPVAWAMIQFGGALSGGTQCGSLGTFAANVSATGEGNGTAIASSMMQQSPAANVAVTGPLLDPAQVTASVTGPDANHNYTMTVVWVGGWTVDFEVQHGFLWNSGAFGGSGGDETTSNGSEGWTNSMTGPSSVNPVGQSLTFTVVDTWNISHGNTCKVTQG